MLLSAIIDKETQAVFVEKLLQIEGFRLNNHLQISLFGFARHNHFLKQQNTFLANKNWRAGIFYLK